MKTNNKEEKEKSIESLVDDSDVTDRELDYGFDDREGK